jgi:hypothetical protein
VVGGAFPSSHVAATFVIAFFAVRHRIVPRSMVVVAIGLAISTMYHGYHYAVDVLYGMVVAAVMVVATPWLFDRLERRRTAAVSGEGGKRSRDSADEAATAPAGRDEADARRDASVGEQVEERAPEDLSQHAE